MKIYTKVVVDMGTLETIEEESFEYAGPLLLLMPGGVAPGFGAPPGGGSGTGDPEGDPDLDAILGDPELDAILGDPELDAILGLNQDPLSAFSQPPVTTDSQISFGNIGIHGEEVSAADLANQTPITMQQQLPSGAWSAFSGEILTVDQAKAKAKAAEDLSQLQSKYGRRLGQIIGVLLGVLTGNPALGFVASRGLGMLGEQLSKGDLSGLTEGETTAVNNAFGSELGLGGGGESESGDSEGGGPVGPVEEIVDDGSSDSEVPNVEAEEEDSLTDLAGKVIPGMVGADGQPLTFADMMAGRFDQATETQAALDEVSADWQEFAEAYAGKFEQIRSDFTTDIDKVRTGYNEEIAGIPSLGVKVGLPGNQPGVIPMAPGKHVSVASNKARTRGDLIADRARISGGLLGDEAGLRSNYLTGEEGRILNKHKIGYQQFDDPIQEALSMEMLDKQLANQLAVSTIANPEGDIWDSLIPTVGYMFGNWIAEDSGSSGDGGFWDWLANSG